MSPVWDPELVACILSSHLRLVGEPLVPHHVAPDARAAWLFEAAPYCVLAHSHEADPRFIYANRAALECFEYSWDELIGMPSRLSAEAPNREERDAFLRSIDRRDFASGYRGLRVSKSGRRFWIEDVTLWNLIDDDGHPLGQAATYRRISPA